MVHFMRKKKLILKLEHFDGVTKILFHFLMNFNFLSSTHYARGRDRFFLLLIFTRP